MQLIQEAKKILLEKEFITELDFFIAQTICNLYPDVKQEAKILIAILHSEYRQGAIFIDIFHKKLDERYKEVFDLFDNIDINFLLSSVSQKLGEEIKKPLIEIDGLYCFSKGYAESLGWLEELRNKLIEKNIHSDFIDSLDDELSFEQKSAIINFFSHQWIVLTGGPGRGKTYTAKQIVKKFLDKNPNAIISCCAPTGKAAENLSKVVESISINAIISTKTVHSLLKISPSNMYIDELDEIEADLVIIDECSMIDFTLFSFLVKKIKSTAKVLLIGDPEQLPPVKGTSPFSLIIALEKFFPNLSVSRLTIPLRTQKKGLIDLTDGVLTQNIKLIKQSFLDENVEIKPLESIFSTIPLLIESFIQIDGNEINFENLYLLKILTTHNVGPFGSESINQYCISLLEKKFDKKSFLIPIIFRENDEKIGIYNGQLAYLSYFTDKPIIYLKNKIKLSPTIAPNFEFAFAISIHKSQGSEFSHVLFAIQNISDITKALIYTAVSRAKESLKIFGTVDQLIEFNQNTNKDYCKEICLKIFEDSTLKLC